MQKKLMTLIFIGILMFSFLGCSYIFDEYDEAASDATSEGYYDEQGSLSDEIIINETEPEAEHDIPDSLYFMRNFDYTVNEDGTYSFVGYITDSKVSQYSVYPTIYITTSNGEGYSTGYTNAFNIAYIGRNGEISSLLYDLSDNKYNISGIPFTFVYSTDNGLEKVIPSEPYQYNHYGE